MDPKMNGMFADSNQRTDLFNLWLRASRDFSQVALKLERENNQRKKAAVKVVEWSRAQLEQCGWYSKEDIDDLVKRCEETGQFSDDANFPGVLRLRKYRLVQETSQKYEDEQISRQKITSSGTISTDEAIDLTKQGLLKRKTQRKNMKSVLFCSMYEETKQHVTITWIINLNLCPI